VSCVQLALSRQIDLPAPHHQQQPFPTLARAHLGHLGGPCPPALQRAERHHFSPVKGAGGGVKLPGAGPEVRRRGGVVTMSVVQPECSWAGTDACLLRAWAAAAHHRRSLVLHARPAGRLKQHAVPRHKAVRGGGEGCQKWLSWALGFWDTCQKSRSRAACALFPSPTLPTQHWKRPSRLCWSSARNDPPTAPQPHLAL